MFKFCKILISLIVFLLFFVWASAGDPLLPFRNFFPAFHSFLLFFILLFGIFFLKSDFEAKDFKFGKTPFIILPLSGFLISLAISYVFFQGIPHIQDSVNYLIMAQNFLEGKFHSSMPEHYEFYAFPYMIPDGEKIYSLFLPGFSFFLLPFLWLGVPFLANPLLTAFNVFMVGKIAAKLFNEKIAVLSMFLIVLSSFFVVMGGTWMAHSFCAALTLLAFFAYLNMRESDSYNYPFLLGFSIGFMALSRPQNSLFLAFPFIVDYLIKFVKSPSWSAIRKGVFSLLCFAPFLLFLLYYNSIYTGDPFIFKQDVFFNYSEPRNFCHRFGIGTGCPRSNWIELPLEGLTWSHAALVSYRRLSALTINFLLHPLLFVFMPAAFILAKRRSDFNKLLFLFAPFASNFAGYFFFYFDGNVFGPRYLYETSIFLIVIFAYSIFRIIESPFKNRVCGKIAKTLAFSLLFAGFCYQLIFTFPALYHSYKQGFWNIDAKLKTAVEAAGIKEGIVFVWPYQLYGSGFVLMNHANLEENKILYFRDLGERENRRIMLDYPNKKYYRAAFAKMERNDELPEITEIFPGRDDGVLHIELEYKFYPLTGVPDYCNSFPERSYLDKYLEIKPPYKYLVPTQFLFFCRFVTTEQYYDFAQKINESGTYRIVFKALRNSDMGNFNFFVDDRLAAFLKFNNSEEKFDETSITLRLEKGLRKFKISPAEVVGKYSYFMVDWIDFILIKGDSSSSKEGENLRD